MTSVGTFEAKTHLTHLLERVAKGERIIITNRGKPVAMLVPPEADNERDTARIGRALQRWVSGARAVTSCDLSDRSNGFGEDGDRCRAGSPAGRGDCRSGFDDTLPRHGHWHGQADGCRARGNSPPLD